MMDFPKLIILDVGHGNCAILQDTDAITVIDCPSSSILVETLERLDIEVVNNVLISHSDVDHAGGLSTLLDSVFVENVYINPDASKRSINNGALWKGVRIALELAEQKGTIVHPALTSTLSKKIHSGQVEIEILSPSSGVALGGAGGEDLEGHQLNSNSMSVVIGLVHEDYRVVLLPGDMDAVGLDNLLKRQKNIEAHILVFPHHGGTPGQTDPQNFALKLGNLVKPSLVVFSHNRYRFQNPREDIMQGIVLAVPNAHIMCTQLSLKCAVNTPSSDFKHLLGLPAAGHINDSCCGGTILVKINGKHTNYAPLPTSHKNFVTDASMVPEPLCLTLQSVYRQNRRQSSGKDLPIRFV